MEQERLYRYQIFVLFGVKKKRSLRSKSFKNWFKIIQTDGGGFSKWFSIDFEAAGRPRKIFVHFGVLGVFGNIKSRCRCSFSLSFLLRESGRNDLGEVLISALGPKGRLRSAAEQEIQVHWPGDRKSREKVPTSEMSHVIISSWRDYSPVFGHVYNLVRHLRSRFMFLAAIIPRSVDLGFLILRHLRSRKTPYSWKKLF